MEFLFFDVEVGLDGGEEGVVGWSLKLRLIQTLFNKCLGFFEIVAFDEADDRIELHRIPLILRQKFILIKLCLDPLSKFLPIQ